jgi:hypothetical protein
MTHAPVAQIMMCGIGLACVVPYIVEMVRSRFRKH